MVVETLQDVQSILRQERERKGISMRKLGVKSGTNYQTVSNSEKRDITISTMMALCEALGLRVYINRVIEV